MTSPRLLHAATSCHRGESDIERHYASEQVTENYCLDSCQGVNGVHTEMLQMTSTQVKNKHIHTLLKSQIVSSRNKHSSIYELLFHTQVSYIPGK